ncbi:MAG: hypothetical protein IJ460_08650 [Clostridia bacterium]|nr:hypothetical protein [Clostridia bacterium]
MTTILGSYNSCEGGRIYLNLADNLETQSMAGTFLHEQGHAALSTSTTLGCLESFFLAEAMLAEEQGYSTSCTDRARLIHEHTRQIQEIFANNIELLTLEEHMGREHLLRSLASRPEEYQMFYTAMMPVHRANLTYREKKAHIFMLCSYAMNILMPASALTETKLMAEYLQGAYSPDTRLTSALNAYIENGVPSQDNLSFENFIEVAENAFIYIKPYIKDARDTGIKLTSDFIENEMTQRMLKSVSLFEPTMLQPKRIIGQKQTEADVFLVLKQVQNLLNEKNFYLIAHEKTYISEETDADRLNSRIEKCISVCITMPEYGKDKKTPRYFDTQGKLLTVIIRTAEECYQWLRRAQKHGTVYTGELRALCRQADVSMLFFCIRGEPERIFVFPTLSIIKDELIKNFSLGSQFYQADNREFLKLFSHLDGELEMISYFKGISVLLLNRTWEEIMKNDSLFQLFAPAGKILGDSALCIKPREYYKILAALPQKSTLQAPLFVLMRFKGDENTGDTYAEPNTKAPLLFPTKAAADRFAAQNSPEFTGVGLDKIYWHYFKRMINKIGGKVILVTDGNRLIGKLADVNEVGEVWYRQG